MTNKEAVEYIAALFGGIAVAATGNIGGRNAIDGFTCSLHDAASGIGLTITCEGYGLFEATLTGPGADQRLKLLANPEKRGFEQYCEAFKTAYYSLRGVP